MAKTNKTVGKTTTNPKKGVATMTIATALTKFQIGYNNYQEYRRENKQSYDFANKQDIAAFAKTLKPEELKRLAQTYLYQLEMELRFAAFKYREHRKNLAYGIEYTHPAELEQPDAQKKEQQAKQQQDIDMIKSAKRAARKTHKKISQELAKEETAQKGGN